MRWSALCPAEKLHYRGLAIERNKHNRSIMQHRELAAAEASSLALSVGTWGLGDLAYPMKSDVLAEAHSEAAWVARKHQAWEMAYGRLIDCCGASSSSESDAEEGDGDFAKTCLDLYGRCAKSFTCSSMRRFLEIKEGFRVVVRELKARRRTPTGTGPTSAKRSTAALEPPALLLLRLESSENTHSFCAWICGHVSFSPLHLTLLPCDVQQHLSPGPDAEVLRISNRICEDGRVELLDMLDLVLQLFDGMLATDESSWSWCLPHFTVQPDFSLRVESTDAASWSSWGSCATTGVREEQEEDLADEDKESSHIARLVSGVTRALDGQGTGPPHADKQGPSIHVKMCRCCHCRTSFHSSVTPHDSDLL